MLSTYCMGSKFLLEIYGLYLDFIKFMIEKEDSCACFLKHTFPITDSTNKKISVNSHSCVDKTGSSFFRIDLPLDQKYMFQTISIQIK